MEPIQILYQALVDIKRVYDSTWANDAAFRKQCRIILNKPEVNHALARARDAPEPQEAAIPPKPAKKRTTKPKPSTESD